MKSWLIIAIVLIAILTISCARKAPSGPGGILDKPTTPPAGSPEAGRKQITSAMTWTVIICALGIGAGIALVILGQRTLGIAIGAGSIATTVAALTISQHLQLISYLGLGLGTVSVGLLIYTAWLNRRAIYELVATGEAGKPLLDLATKLALYGDDKTDGIAGKIQHPITEALVKAARDKIKTGA